MKQEIKQLILISFLSLTSTFAFGQVRVGVSGGVNFTNGTFDHTLSKPKIALGYHAGLLAHVYLHKKVYLQPQIQYSLQGWSFNHLVRGSRMNLHYVNLPLLVAYQPIPKVSLLLGPQVGMLLQAKVQPESTIDFNEIYRKIDIGIALGAKYHLTSNLELGVRYIHGLTYLGEATMTDENGNPSGTQRDGYNRTVQVGISYLFGKK